MAVAVTLEIQIPGDVYSTLKSHGVNRENLVVESQRLLALRFFREHLLSLGQAARLSGMDYWSFTEFLSQNNVSLVYLDAEELEDEVSAVKRLSQRLSNAQ